MNADGLLNNDVKTAPVHEDIIRCVVVISSTSVKSGIVTVSVDTSLTAATLIVFQYWMPQAIRYTPPLIEAHTYKQTSSA